MQTMVLQSSPENSLPQPLSVSLLSRQLKETLEGCFSYIRVQGELAGVKRHTSGHIYFSLRDREASLDGVCWKGVAQKLQNIPQDGSEVIATGRITTFPGRSKYQLVVTQLELAGVGDILKRIQELKERLQKEGLFDPGKRRSLPRFPKKIGVITSPTGAVIQDILHRLQDRYPCQVLLWPVLVQGDGAAMQIAKAIDGMNQLPVAHKPDVIILARGGGSVEDLMAFNEEVVVRAVASSQLPLITGVGHETDTTLVDFAADRRAPTPTGAAEIATPVTREVRHQLQQLGERVETKLIHLHQLHQTTLAGLSRPLEQYKEKIYRLEQRLDDCSAHLQRFLQHTLRQSETKAIALLTRLRAPQALIEKKSFELDAKQRQLICSVDYYHQFINERLKQTGRMLNSLSYKGTLSRGYTVIRQGDEKIITESAALDLTKPFSIQFKDKTVYLQEKIRRQRKTISLKSSEKQGSLL